MMILSILHLHEASYTAITGYRNLMQMSVMKAHGLQMFESDFAEGLRQKFKLCQLTVDFLKFFLLHLN